jgi:hypothetical protein
MAQSKLQLDEFDFKFESCATMAVLGKRRTGKSTLGNFVMCRLVDRGLKRITVFCGNKDNMVEWQRIVHPLFVHGADIDKITEIVDYQEKRVGADSAAHEARETEKQKYDRNYLPQKYEVPLRLQVGIVFDDLGSNKKIMKHDRISFMSINGRHLGIVLIQLNQYIVQLPPDCRDQQDYIFVLQMSNAKGVDRLYNEYVTDACVEKKHFGYILSACTGKRGKCLLIDNTAGYTIQERLKYVKIPYPPHREFIGSKQYVRYGKKHYLSEQNRKVNQPIQTPMDRNYANQFDENSYIPSEMTNGSSVVSLDRNKHYDVNKIREGREMFRDKKGNLIEVHLTGGK